MGGPLNVSYELHRMFGSPRAAKFLDFVTGKRSPEPFLCWQALERLIGEVRDNTLESPESRASKVKAIVEEFVSESAPNQLGLPMSVRDKMEELYRNVVQSSEFWDGRPLLMLQREAELMLLPDVREFAENNPWLSSDAASTDGGLSATLVVSAIPHSKLTDHKRAELLKKMAAARPAPSSSQGSSRASIRQLITRRRNTSLSLRNRHDKNGDEEEGMVAEIRPCRLGRQSVQVLVAASSTGSNEDMAASQQVDFEIRLLGMTMAVLVEQNVLEVSGVGGASGMVFLLRCEDAVQLAEWTQAISGCKERLEITTAHLREKRQRILGMTVVPPPKAASTSATALVATPELAKAATSSPRTTSSPRSNSSPRTAPPAMLGDMGSGYRAVTSLSDMAAASGYGNDVRMLEKYGVVGAGASTGYAVSFPAHAADATEPGGGGGEDNGMVVEASSDEEQSSESSELREGSAAGGRDDFNEIFQRCVTKLRHLEVAPPSADNDKVRTETYVELIGLAEDFVTSAVRYGQIIVSEVYLPLSRKTIRPDTTVGGVIGGEKFIVHNIMFKFALDSHSVFGGSDESAAKVAGLELKGLQAYMSSGTPELCYPLMALIDYKGFRLVASSLLPLTRNSLQYGSQDAAVTVKKGLPPLTQRIEEASASLNLKLHEAGKDRVVMATAVDIEGHLGKDSRFYLLDFSRVFPPVTPNRQVEGSHLFQMFRPEFVKSFTLFPLCSDAYSNFTAGLPHAREHAEEVDLATNELLNVSVSNFVAELIARMGEEARIAGNLESFALTQLLHSHGINVRYLGEVLRKMGRHPFGLVVLLNMVARVVKIGFRKTLRAEMKRLRVSIDEPYRIAAKDFLNLVFSSSAESESYWSEEVPRLLNQRFQLRPGNWNAFPKSLKRAIFDVEKVNGVAFNAKAVLFLQVQQALGLKVAPSLVALLQTQPKVYAQKAVFDDVDVEDVGLRVKFLDVISNAQGFVFSKRAEEKEKDGFFEAARSLYHRAYMGYQAALGSCPNDSILLRNCAMVMTKLYRLDAAMNHTSASLQSASLDDPLLFGAQMSFKKAIQANRKSPLFYASYADFLRDLGSLEDAEAHYLEALMRDPFSVATLRSYAGLLEQMGEREHAALFSGRARDVEHATAAAHAAESSGASLKDSLLDKLPQFY